MGHDELKLGKGATLFVKSQLRRLHQEDEIWEADFRGLPKQGTKTETRFLGMVLTQPDGYMLADVEIRWTPTANDLAKLLAEAMRRPMALGSHRPRYVHVHDNPHWHELFPHLKEIGIEVSIQDDLPKLDEAFEEWIK